MAPIKFNEFKSKEHEKLCTFVSPMLIPKNKAQEALFNQITMAFINAEINFRNALNKQK